ncbi:MAG: hypothetical protein HY820_15650 [Acidobacteria bacterium]|nr:hypothetical protein [Acidobacteriota bacterium]
MWLRRKVEILGFLFGAALATVFIAVSAATKPQSSDVPLYVLLPFVAPGLILWIPISFAMGGAHTEYQTISDYLLRCTTGLAWAFLFRWIARAWRRFR